MTLSTLFPFPRLFRLLARRGLLSVAASMLALTSAPAHAWTKYLIDPCTPDSAITCDSTKKHQVYTPTSPARNELAVFVGGSSSKPADYDKLSETLASHGYHVINLRYVNNTSIESACDTSYPGDLECHRRFRSESIWGENITDPSGSAYNSSSLSINAANSAANRMLKLVSYLSTTSPYSSQGWAQFRNTGSYNSTYGTYNLNWPLVALSGHSQGSGMALYVAKFHNVLRVAMYAGPQDTWSYQGQNYVAPWITDGGFATSMAKVYGFANDKESLYARQLAAWAALGLPGSVTDVSTGYPYGNSHRLKTTSPTIWCAHSSVATDTCTPGDPPTYAPVWNYTHDGG